LGLCKHQIDNLTPRFDHRRQSLGIEGVTIPRFWAGGRGGHRGRGRVVKHYYILSCTAGMHNPPAGRIRPRRSFIRPPKEFYPALGAG